MPPEFRKGMNSLTGSYDINQEAVISQNPLTAKAAKILRKVRKDLYINVLALRPSR